VTEEELAKLKIFFIQMGIISTLVLSGYFIAWGVKALLF
jgi:hypothetical protein